MAHINWNDVNGVCLNTYEYGNSLNEAQNQLLNQICSTSSSSIQQVPPSNTIMMHHLSDIIKVYGDLAVKCMTQDYSPGDPLSITIDCIMYDTKYSTLRNQINKEQENDIEKENNKMNNNMSNNTMFDSFKGMFGKVDSGMCRLSMNGNIAVKTSNGYKSYNIKEGRLVNCANFVFPMGDEMFFIIPTNKVEAGDIIIVAGLPKCVLKKDSGTITVINYEDSTVETILPERHIFMGETYFYGKVVSMFGEDIICGGKKSMNKIMKFMMMSEMMKGFGGNSQNNAMANMMPLMMMSGGMGDMFSGIFDFGTDEEETEHVEGETDNYDLLTSSLRDGKLTGEEFIKKVEELAHGGTDKRAESKD